MRFGSIILFLLFITQGCSSRKILLQKKLSDNSQIEIFYFNVLSTSPDYCWVLRKLNNECYLTGKVNASPRYDEMKISNETDTGFKLSFNYRITEKDTEWVHFNILFRDTFCLNNDCKKYPINCGDF
jgi:hypothetical protein